MVVAVSFWFGIDVRVVKVVVVVVHSFTPIITRYSKAEGYYIVDPH